MSEKRDLGREDIGGSGTALVSAPASPAASSPGLSIASASFGDEDGWRDMGLETRLNSLPSAFSTPMAAATQALVILAFTLDVAAVVVLIRARVVMMMHVANCMLLFLIAELICISCQKRSVHHFKDCGSEHHFKDCV